MEKNDKEERDTVEIDLGTARISFGGLFKGLGGLIDLVSQANAEGVKRSGEIGGLPRGAKGVYGFSVRTLAGKPVIETFGNVRQTAAGPVVEEVREPIVDVFDERDHVLVIAELPGVAEAEIKIEVKGDMLILAAGAKNRKYAREVLLPCRVKPAATVTYRNGILEVRLDKEK